jgi:hypothetical protein
LVVKTVVSGCQTQAWKVAQGCQNQAWESCACLGLLMHRYMIYLEFLNKQLKAVGCQTILVSVKKA